MDQLLYTTMITRVIEDRIPKTIEVDAVIGADGANSELLMHRCW